MKNDIICSIIIRSYNEEKHIGRLIDGINKQKNVTGIEIIVVDSGSTDSTTYIAHKMGASVISIRSGDFSFGRALNIGCSAAKGKYLLFASAHVYPLYTNWIEKMLKPFEDEKVGLVYGRQTGNENTRYSELQLMNKWFPKESNYNQLTPFCNNANAIVRRSLWEEQPYDESLTGLEDLDWGLKIQKKGWKIVYEAHASIVHVHEENASKIKNRYRREAIALKRILPNQSMNLFDFIRLTVINIVIDVFHAFHERKLFLNFRDIVQFRTMQFLGTYIGFRQKNEVDAQLRKRFYYPNELKKKNKEPEYGERIIYSAVES
ncbi:MAG TPA: glycosyltransferase family 2 protein [Panacibacter sp.]|mgnify:CR=1 FL=1|nr:glycosyltransferase family 2 protein [Panacibacter sp.]HNP46632.1 glycosyltransferase family 2 protein [Panacibacter sp.]